MASPVILRKRNRKFASALKPNHSKFEDLRNSFVKLKALKSLPFLATAKSSRASAKYLRKSASDTYLLNWKVKKKELRKIEKQFVEIKIKNEEELNCKRATQKRNQNEIAKIKSEFESTMFNSFPMQFGNLFTLKGFPFAENSILDSFGSLFSKVNTKVKDASSEKAVNTSSSKVCKQIQTDGANSKAQNVRVKKRSKKIQTDPTDDRNFLNKRIERKSKAANLNYQTSDNEYIEELPRDGNRIVSKVNSKVSRHTVNIESNQKISKQTQLNPSALSFNCFMDSCGLKIFSNSVPQNDIHQRNSPKSTSHVKSAEDKAPKFNKTSLKVNYSSNSKFDESSNFPSLKKLEKPIKLNNTKSSSDKQKFRCNTATMDQVCSIESKNSIDLIALRNFILKYSPLSQKSTIETKETVNSIKSDETYKKTPGKRSRSSKTKSIQPNNESKLPRKVGKRKVKKRQSRDQNVGTDCDEITNLVSKRTEVNLRLKSDITSSASSIPNLDFKPIIFNQNETQIFAMSENSMCSKRIKKSATFRSGLVKKSTKQQTVSSKFVGRRGNIFDYVSCITSTSSIIYSSAESIKKIFARSKMSILTVPSDYNSLMMLLNKSTEQNIAMINCDDLKKDNATKAVEEKSDGIAKMHEIIEEVSQEEVDEEKPVINAVKVEECIEKVAAKKFEMQKEKSLNFEISDEENVIEIGKNVSSKNYDIETKESKTRKYRKIGNKILKTISKLSHRKKPLNISDSKVLKKSSDKLYKKKYKEILKDHKIQQEFIALKKNSFCKYIFNIGQIEGITTSPVIINLRVDSLELSAKSSNKNNKLKNIFNCVTSKPSNDVYQKTLDIKPDASNTQYKKYSDEIIAKEEQRSLNKSFEEIVAQYNATSMVPLPLNCSAASSKLELEDIMNKSLEDIRILFRSVFSSETEISENELGDQNKTVEKQNSANYIQNKHDLIELRLNPSNAGGEKCFVNPISIYVDPNTEAIAVDGKYKIDCVDTIVVDASIDTMCHDKELKKAMRIQVNLLLHQM